MYDTVLDILQMILREVRVQAIFREVCQQDTTRTAEPTGLTVLVVLAMVAHMIVSVASARGTMCEIVALIGIRCDRLFLHRWNRDANGK